MSVNNVNAVNKIIPIMKHEHKMSVGKACFATRESIPEKPRSTKVFRRLSYYLNGGVDPTGRALDTTQVSYDTEADLGAGCGVDALCDPRISFFDMVESVGNSMASEIVGSMKQGFEPNSSPTPAPTPTPDPQSTE